MKQGKRRSRHRAPAWEAGRRGAPRTDGNGHSAARLVRIALSVVVFLLVFKLAIDRAGRTGWIGPLTEELIEASALFVVLACGSYAARANLTLPAVRRAVVLVWVCVAINQLCDVGEKVQVLAALPFFGSEDAVGNFFDVASGFGTIAALFVALYLSTIEVEKRGRERRQLNDTLLAAQSMARVGYWDYGVDTKALTWSKLMFSVFGVDPESGQPDYEDHRNILHPDDWDLFDASFNACINEGRPFSIVIRIIFPGESTHYVQTQGFPRVDPGGAVVALFGISQDITDRKRAEEEILRLSRFPSENPNPVFRVGADGTVLYANEGSASLLAEWGSGLGSRLPTAYAKIVGEVLESGVRAEMDVPCRERSMLLTFSPIAGNQEVNIYGMDITERKRVEEELEKHRGHLEELVQNRTTQLDSRVAEAEELNSAMVNVMEDLRVSNVKLKATGSELMASNKELDAFSRSVSHDLRAPLRHSEGFVKLLLEREKGRLDPTSLRYLETIAESSNRMGRLIDDLLAFSRTGRAEMHLQHVDSNAVVREARKGLSPMMEGRCITWEVGDLPTVAADRGLLRLVWENLISNAIKYTGLREEARIEIGEGGREGAGEIAFFVRDNGVGFDPQYTHKLFGVFQRLHRDDEFEGTGIGLATVYHIVHRHGGRVWAEGKVDHGATFHFTLKEARGEE